MLKNFGANFAAVSAAVEQLYQGAAQDIEGALVQIAERQFKVVLVQTRSQV